MSMYNWADDPEFGQPRDLSQMDFHRKAEWPVPAGGDVTDAFLDTDQLIITRVVEIMLDDGADFDLDETRNESLDTAIEWYDTLDAIHDLKEYDWS